VVAGSYTTYLAVTREDAMVVGDYYKQGRAINQDLRRDRVATQLGLDVGLRYDPLRGTLHGRVLSAGMPMAGPVRVLLAHPTLPERDRQLLAAAGPDGSFDMALGRIESTHWQVTVENGARTWRLEGGWNWPRQAILELKADTPAHD
jgi:hypothetical protein